MSECMEKMLGRRSVRSYLDTPIPEEKLERIIEAGLYAPSGMNRQSAIILEVTDRATRDKLSKLNAAVMGSDGDPFYGAPVVLCVLADRSAFTAVYDGSLVMGNLLLAAHDENLGACWIHRAKEVFDSPEGKEILASAGIEGDWEGIGNCVIGYPADPLPPARPRKEKRVFRIG